MANNQPDTAQNINSSAISISELQKKYQISRDTLYTRMRYLKIKTHKISGKVYLDAQQVEYMDGLHEHIQQTGRMQGYLVPEPSRPMEEEQPSTAALTVAETPAPAPTQNCAPKQQRLEPTPIEDVAAVVASAQNKAAGTLIAENILAQHFIENPDLLPDDLKAKIKESAQIPSIDPFAYANSLLSKAMGLLSVV